MGGDALHQQGLVVDGAADPLPSPGARSFVIADLDSGEILAAQNAHTPLPPASTMKMLTALTVLPRVDLQEIYTAGDDDVAVEGSKVGVVSGSTYTARNLLEGMFLISGNDAAHALANLNGGVGATVRQMQAEAWRVQAYDTVVRNPSGLDAPGQVSTAYDLALIARAGLQRPDFAEYAALANSTFPHEGTSDPTQRPTFEIWNQNTLVTGGVEGAIGVKSGYTSQAGRTFAAAAERDGKRYLVTLMGIPGNTYQSGATYLEWAFANADGLDPVGALVAPKYELSQSDAAVVVPSTGGTAAARLAGAEQRTSDASGSGGPSMVIVTPTLASSLLLWLGLRREQRKAWRRQPLVAPQRRGPGRSGPQPPLVPQDAPATIDLRRRHDARVEPCPSTTSIMRSSDRSSSRATTSASV